jgi:hypothetical protein
MKATLNKTGKIILKTSAKLNNRLTRFSIKSVVTISLIFVFFLLIVSLVVLLPTIVMVMIANLIILINLIKINIFI